MSKDLKPWEKYAFAAFLALFLAAAVVSLAAPQYLQPDYWRARNAPAVETDTNDIAPAPTVCRGPIVRYKGKLVSSWYVGELRGVGTDPGDLSYKGVYAASGSYGGETSYTNGSRWLFWDGVEWALAEAPQPQGPGEAYIGESAEPLPGGTWAYVDAASPAPTVVEYSTVPDPGFAAYTYYWFDDAPFTPTPSPLKPCLATIGSVAYLVLRNQDLTSRGFIMCRLSDHEWDEAYNAGVYSADPYQSGGLFDAGDDTHVYVNNGAYLDGATPKCLWQQWAPTYGSTAAVVSQQTLTLADIDISNCVETSAGNWRFILRNGAQVQLCSYAYGAGSYSVIHTWASVDALPSGYTDVALGSDGQTDHSLFVATGGNMYWVRHCESGSLHRLVPYLVTDTTCTQVSDVIACASNDGMQTWGNYTDLSRCVCEIGSGGTGASPVAPAGVYWAPGNPGQARAAFAPPPATRRWFLDGTPLLCAGWLSTAYSNVPFLMEIEPIALSEDAAGSYAVTLPIVRPHGATYGVDEAPAGVLEQSAECTYAATLALAQDNAATYALAQALSHDAAASYGADLGTIVLTPASVDFDVQWVRMKSGVG